MFIEVQYKPFADAYRVYGDPNWVDLVSMFNRKQRGEGQPENEDVLLLSSETSEETEQNLDATDDVNPLQSLHLPPMGFAGNSSSTAESRIGQRSIWDYVGYIADSESSMNSERSTNSTARKPVSEILMRVQRPQRGIQPSRHASNGKGRASGTSSSSSNFF